MALYLNRIVRSIAMGALAVAGLTVSAQAQGARVGMLTCDVSGGTGYVVQSTKALDCLFMPSDGTPPEHYVGAVNRFGFDVGVTGPGKLAWGVFAPTSYPGPGQLQGTYTGLSGGATIGAGATANYLVGGNAGSFALQALSISGQTGLNVTAAIGQITLQYAPPERSRRSYRRHRHHHRHYR